METLSVVRSVVVVVAVQLLLGASAAAAQESVDGDELAVRGVIEGFKNALTEGRPEAAMGFLHPDTRIFESGHAEQSEEYRAGHLEADIAFLQSVASETTWYRLQVGSDLALYMSEYRTHGTFRGRDIDSHGTETIVLVRTAEGWQILHIHWSHAS
jgi:hypothetical protein